MWTSLGHLYVFLRRLGDATRAFERAAEVEPLSVTLPIPMPKLFTAFR